MRRTSLMTGLSLMLLGLGACDQGGGAPAAPAAIANPEDAPAAYLKYCGDCHVPPRPTAHPAGQWPGVVSRMQQHRLANGLGAIPDAALGEILDYLQGRIAGS